MVGRSTPFSILVYSAFPAASSLAVNRWSRYPDRLPADKLSSLHCAVDPRLHSTLPRPRKPPHASTFSSPLGHPPSPRTDGPVGRTSASRSDRLALVARADPRRRRRRGPEPPLKWSATENVLWEAPIPGRGHGSPTVVGDRVFLAAADTDAADAVGPLLRPQDRASDSGRRRSTAAASSRRGNAKSTHASSTPACDGERVFINFLNGGADRTPRPSTSTANSSGRRRSPTTCCTRASARRRPSTSRSCSSRPTTRAAGVIAGLDRATGKVVWKRDRPKLPNYASPIVLHVAGRDQLLMTGCDLVTEPRPAHRQEALGDQGLDHRVRDLDRHRRQARSSPAAAIRRTTSSAVQADGSGKVAWENNTRVYVPVDARPRRLPLRRDRRRRGHVLEVATPARKSGRSGSAGRSAPRRCWSATTSSPPTRPGRRSSSRPSPDGFTLLAENQLGDEAIATPVFCGGRMYTARRREGGRQAAGSALLHRQV